MHSIKFSYLHIANPWQTLGIGWRFLCDHKIFFFVYISAAIRHLGSRGRCFSVFLCTFGAFSPTSYAKLTKNSLIQIYARNAPHFLDSCCYSLISKILGRLGASSRLLMIIQKGLIVELAGVKFILPLLCASPCHSTQPSYITCHNRVTENKTYIMEIHSLFSILQMRLRI